MWLRTDLDASHADVAYILYHVSRCIKWHASRAPPQSGCPGWCGIRPVPRMHAENDVARSQSEKSKRKSSKSDVKRLSFAKCFRDPPEFPYFPESRYRRGYGGTVGSLGVRKKKTTFGFPIQWDAFQPHPSPFWWSFKVFYGRNMLIVHMVRFPPLVSTWLLRC